MNNIIVLGAQWGDEGKGKLVDLLSDRFDVVVRYQGGHNAGHTILIGDRKFVLKLIPSGILHPGKSAVIGNGLVVDPIALVSEIDALEAAGVDVSKRLRISNRAHVLLPFHRMMERLSEARPGRISIGTTSRGIGPCYEDKMGRRGIRFGDFVRFTCFDQAYESLRSEKVEILEGIRFVRRSGRRRRTRPLSRRSPNGFARWYATPPACLTTKSARASGCYLKAPRAPCWTWTMARIRLSLRPVRRREAPAPARACRLTTISGRHRDLQGLHHASRRRSVPHRTAR